MNESSVLSEPPSQENIHVERNEEWWWKNVKPFIGALMFQAHKLTNGNKEDVKDLYQITLLKSWNYRNKYDPAFSFSTWIMRIMLNTHIDDFRKMNRKKKITISIDETREDSDGDQLFFQVHSPGDEKSILLKFKVDQVMELAPKLDPISQDILYYLSQGMTYEEIQEEYSIPIGTVKAHIFRMRSRLLELMGEKDID